MVRISWATCPDRLGVYSNGPLALSYKADRYSEMHASYTVSHIIPPKIRLVLVRRDKANSGSVCRTHQHAHVLVLSSAETRAQIQVTHL